MARGLCNTRDRRATLLLGMFAGLIAAGCVNPLAESQSTSNPGQLVGTFAVSATEGANSCGAGALGAPATYTFNVTMSVNAGIIYWNDNNGTVIPGTLAADGVNFTFATTAITDMRAASATTTSSSGGVGGSSGTGITPITSASATASSSSTGLVALPPCSIERDDNGTGTLVGNASGVSSFSGTLAFGFTPTEGSSCLDLVQSATPTFETLPCSISYQMNGARTQ